jgi:hypothetical protein
VANNPIIGSTEKLQLKNLLWIWLVKQLHYQIIRKYKIKVAKKEEEKIKDLRIDQIKNKIRL